MNISCKLKNNKITKESQLTRRDSGSRGWLSLCTMWHISGLTGCLDGQKACLNSRNAAATLLDSVHWPIRSSISAVVVVRPPLALRRTYNDPA